ncbi:MAG: hypothetical protein QOI06_1567 [Nocardioidaceae bacterium]|jgi:hypothetical protein|nr:hypothetical protein [Nocardioidaceae bacterium]
MLRDSEDAAVRDLLVARPDLGVPKPATFSQVASRATTRESVRDVLDTLDALDLWVAQRASAFAGALSAADIDGVDRETAAAALERLRRLALLWGDADALRPVRALATELGQAPLGPTPDVDPPSFEGAVRQEPDRVDKVAAGSAFELVRRIEVLAERTDHTPIRLRHDGGLAHREARVVGSLLDLPVGIAVQHAQIAQAAGLIGVVPQGRTDTLLPTAGFDTWQGLRLAEQWAWLARGWMTGHPASGTPALKALCFRAFGPPSDGRVLEPSDIQRWLAWNVPRLLEESTRRAATMFAQASWVGITGLGALASFGLGVDLSALERLLPERAETVLVQNDLTAIAPGPLTPDAARELGALADVESRGGATVYRFTIESLRRAHSMGWSSGEIAAALTSRSVTPIPQPLRYLIGDLDRADAPATSTVHPQVGRTWSAIHHRGVRAPVTALAGAGDGPKMDVETATHIVTELRHAAGPEVRPETSDLTAAEGMADSPLETLREAVETGELVWVGYLDTRGEPGERLVYASAVEDGRVTARDSRTSERLSVPVHRITAAHIIRGASV